MDDIQWNPPKPTPFPSGKRELLFALAMAFTGLLTANAVICGGFQLGFAAGVVLSLVFSVVYLLRSGKKPDRYSLAVLALCAVIALGFGRSDDGFVKFILFVFLFFGINLGLSLLSGNHRYAAHRFQTLGDSFSTFFGTGMGCLSPSVQGLYIACRKGRMSRNLGAVLLGIGIAVPVLLIVVPLLISADAAFDGLVALLPKFDFPEFLGTLVFGAGLSAVLYTRGTGLIHLPKAESPAGKTARGLSVLTVNTVLGMVCAVYAAYLLSQLAYLSGGFSGLLPAEYTLAQYARRGFFEMALLCGINLAVIALSMAAVKKEGQRPLSLRLLCLFIGVVSLFLVATASAKMLLYIGSYGLTRLRLLTQIIMLFFAITTGIVMVWLFVPRLPYMKVVILTALIMGALVIWLDVDTMVARYNVDAYLTGRLDSIDLFYLRNLGNGAVPQLARLSQEAPSAEIAREAKACLSEIPVPEMDLRSWNWASAAAKKYLP